MSKIFYGLGFAGLAAGIAFMASGRQISGLLLAIGGGVTLLMTFFVKKLIEAGNPEHIDSAPEGNASLEMKINQKIAGARQNKCKAESEIRRLTAWSNDAIFTAYQPEFEKVNAHYQKDELLSKYGEIREKFGAGLTFETMEKCDGIVKDYSQKISGYKERMEVFDKEQQEYIALKEKIKAVKQHEKMMKKLQSHEAKLENASEKEAASIVAGDYDLSRLSMDSIEKEVAEKEEYYRQLDKINFQLKQ